MRSLKTQMVFEEKFSFGTVRGVFIILTGVTAITDLGEDITDSIDDTVGEDIGAVADVSMEEDSHSDIEWVAIEEWEWEEEDTGEDQEVEHIEEDAPADEAAEGNNSSWSNSFTDNVEPL